LGARKISEHPNRATAYVVGVIVAGSVPFGLNFALRSHKPDVRGVVCHCLLGGHTRKYG